MGCTFLNAYRFESVGVNSFPSQPGFHSAQPTRDPLIDSTYRPLHTFASVVAQGLRRESPDSDRDWSR